MPRFFRPRSIDPVLIRPATPADIPSMRAIELDAVTAAHWGVREYEALFAAEAPKRVAFVAEEAEGRICGFAIARCGLGEWEIENVAVAAEFRRKGIGSLLVRRVLTAARVEAATSVLLEVRESNQAAVRMYRRLGFSPLATRSGYYQNPVEDALIMRHSVAES